MCNDLKNIKDDDSIIASGWDIAREIIRNENDLVNHRMSAFLTLQGFLFAALMVGSSALANESNINYRPLLAIILLAVCCLGFVSPRLVIPSLRAAFRHIDATNEWWKCFSDRGDAGKQYRISNPFPVLIGKQAMSKGLIFFCENKGQDGDYRELNLDCSAYKRIGIRYEMGIHQIPDYLTRIWLADVILYIVTAANIAISYMSIDKALIETKVTIVESKGNNRVTISYEGEPNKIADFVRRIQAIPNTGEN